MNIEHLHFADFFEGYQNYLKFDYSNIRMNAIRKFIKFHSQTMGYHRCNMSEVAVRWRKSTSSCDFLNLVHFFLRIF